jgi:hypothetical protein
VSDQDTTAELRRISAEHMDRCGEQLFLHTEKPGSTTRFVFPDRAVPSREAAIGYALEMLDKARKGPRPRLVSEFPIGPGRSVRVRQHTMTFSAAVLVDGRVMEADTFPDVEQATDWVRSKRRGDR